MGDYGQDYQKGYHGGGWNSDTDMSAFNAGQWNRQREQEEAARKSQGSTNWAAGTGGGEGGGIGLVLVMGIAMVGAAIWAARYMLMGVAAAIAATATMLWLLMPLLGTRPGWRQSVGQAVLACVFALLGVLGAVAVAWLVSWFGGPELIPGIGYVTAGMISLLDLPANTGPTGAVFPGLAALGAATWWLDRKLPAGGAHKGLRWAVIAAVLLAGPVAGLWYGQTLWNGFAPLDFDAIFDVTAPVSQSDARRSALGAVVVGALVVAGVAALAAKLLVARGWRIAPPRKVAVRVGLAYALYGTLLAVMLILFRGADPLVRGMAEGLAPNGTGFGGASGGLGGLVLIQLVPFAFFAAIARKAVAEPGALRRFALGAGAMLLVLLVTLVAIAAGWMLLFASA